MVVAQIDVALMRGGGSYQPHYKEASVAFSRIMTPDRANYVDATCDLARSWNPYVGFRPNRIAERHEITRSYSSKHHG